MASTSSKSTPESSNQRPHVIEHEKKPWQLEFGEYIKQGEPARARKAESWQTAIGLQQVDGLEVSDYLIDTAKKHIEGHIDTRQARKRIESYYEERRERGIIESETEEADIVSQRIAELLGERTFQLSPVAWLGIHKRLFEGIFAQAGRMRDYNITKREWVLNGDTVTYAPYDDLAQTLDYDFNLEKSFSYVDLPIREAIRHIAGFISGIWQIHPFCEGNTRATAVLLIKYLRTLGFEVTNEPFENNSWYFRNALVRANYTNYELSVKATVEPLVRFLENVMSGVHHRLLNRELHVDYQQYAGETGETRVTDPVTDPVNQYVYALLVQLRQGPKSTSELLVDMHLSHRKSFRDTYLNPALEANLIERTIPDKPNSRLQRYRLTEAGRRAIDFAATEGSDFRSPL